MVVDAAGLIPAGRLGDVEHARLPAPAPALAASDDPDLVVVDVEVRHAQALFGFVRRQGLSDVEAQDAVQDVLFRLWLELRRGAVIENPRAWAFRSVYRIAMDHHRLRARIAALARRLERPPGDPPADVADRVAVWSAVEQLPERQRQVLYLRYRADLSFDEIGSVLGITASAARSHATQAVADLRRRLGPEEAR